MAVTTTVVNMRGGNREYDVRIDRKGPFGNPFVLGVDGDRDEVIAKFRHWLTSSTCTRSQWVRDHMGELKDKRLGCWCHPEACHGDVYVELLDA